MIAFVCQLSAFVFFVAMGVTAQQPAGARLTLPEPPQPAPVTDPAVHADGSVTFDLQMPHAEKVSVKVEGFRDPFPMTLSASEGDHWTATAPSLAPRYYNYFFIVDGVNILDPHSVMVKPGALRLQNMFLVPGHQPWEIADVPHGAVTRHDYTSAVVKGNSSYYVYTPPGFDAAAHQTYPVLYLLHGYSDEASAWTSTGKADVILDNLIAAGKARPMIVVMPTGYGDMEMLRRGSVAWQDPALVQRNFDLFQVVLYKEIMPRVTAEYPISKSREDHAIAGLSMGGAETLLTGLNHTSDFAWIGAFSAGGIDTGILPQRFLAITAENAGAISAKLRLVWISCGTDDPLITPNRKIIAWLREQGFAPKAVETPGMHSWMVWRDNLVNFAQLLFQPKT